MCACLYVLCLRAHYCFILVIIYLFIYFINKLLNLTDHFALLASKELMQKKDVLDYGIDLCEGVPGLLVKLVILSRHASRFFLRVP